MGIKQLREQIQRTRERKYRWWQDAAYSRRRPERSNVLYCRWNTPYPNRFAAARAASLLAVRQWRLRNKREVGFLLDTLD